MPESKATKSRGAAVAPNSKKLSRENGAESFSLRTDADLDVTTSQIVHVAAGGAAQSRARGQLDPAAAAALGFDPAARVGSESKTWAGTPDPWDLVTADGTLLLRISNIRATAVRATDQQGVTRCQLFLSELWTTGWGATHYRDNPPLRFAFSYENAAGGRLRYWEFTVHSECGMVNYPMNFSEGFDPDIYDQFARWTRYVFAENFFKC